VRASTSRMLDLSKIEAGKLELPFPGFGNEIARLRARLQVISTLSALPPNRSC
jgi:hypothetical protein